MEEVGDTDCDAWGGDSDEVDGGDVEGVLPRQQRFLQIVGFGNEECGVHGGEGGAGLAQPFDRVRDAGEGEGPVDAGVEAVGGVFDFVDDDCW